MTTPRPEGVEDFVQRFGDRLCAAVDEYVATGTQPGSDAKFSAMCDDIVDQFCRAVGSGATGTVRRNIEAAVESLKAAAFYRILQ